MAKWLLLYLRTAPQYRQSTRKIGLKALVTRKCDVCLTSTTIASTNCSSSTHVYTRAWDTSKNWTVTGIELELELKKRHRNGEVTFTMVLLCRMKVWKPNQRSFMHNSKATMTNASSSRVAWTCRGVGHTFTANCKPRLHVCFIPVGAFRFTYINVQAQRGHSRSLAQREHHEQQAGQQLHHVEQVVVGKQVRCQCFRVARVSEELVVVLSLLNASFKQQINTRG